MRKMTYYLEVMLQDVSGELLKFLAPISNSRANITEIIHMRERKTGNQIPVGVYLEITDKSIIPPLIENLSKMGYSILRQRDLTEVNTKTFIIIGHVFRSGITDLTDRIFQIKGATVRAVNAKIEAEEKASTVSFTIGSDDEAGMNVVVETLEQLCLERNLLLIKPLVIQ